MKPKKITQYMFLAIVLFGYTGCEKDDDRLSKKETVTQKLTSGRWNVDDVRVGGIQESGYLQDLSIMFSGSSLTTTNGDPIFQEKDSWSFSDNEATTIITGDGLEINISSVNNESLIIQFFWNETTLGGGRTNSLAGEYLLTFSK